MTTRDRGTNCKIKFVNEGHVFCYNKSIKQNLYFNYSDIINFRKSKEGNKYANINSNKSCDAICGAYFSNYFINMLVDKGHNIESVTFDKDEFKKIIYPLGSKCFKCDF